MKKAKSVFFVIAITLLCGCGKNNRLNLTKSEYEIAAQTKVTLTLNNITPISAVVTLFNEEENTVFYGSKYKFVLEKEVDGIWYICTRASMSADGYPIVVTDEEIFLEPGMTDSFEISWDFLYGDLPTGKYRFIKEIWISANRHSLTGDFIAAEFAVE